MDKIAWDLSVKRGYIDGNAYGYGYSIRAPEIEEPARSLSIPLIPSLDKSFGFYPDIGLALPNATPSGAPLFYFRTSLSMFLLADLVFYGFSIIIFYN